MYKWLSSIALMGAALLAAPSSTIRPAHLTVEHRHNPTGISETSPRLSWLLEANNPAARGLAQSGYRILVSSTPATLKAGTGDLWDSGKVESPQSVLIPYQGKVLSSGARAYWQVQVWDQAGNLSAWSESAQWSMGLLETSDWKGGWIGQNSYSLYKSPTSPFQLLTTAKWIWTGEGGPTLKAPPGTRWFSTKVTLPAGRVIRHATLVLGADNSYQVSLNSQPAGRGNFPSLPDVLDVASRLKPGENTIVVEAKAGKEAPAGLIGTLQVEFTEGDPLKFSTGPDWQWSPQQTGPWADAKILGPYGMQPWGEVGFIGERALPARMLRKEFTVEPGLVRATAYISGLGLSELYVNGTKAGDDVLSPNLSEYSKRVFYVTHDVTNQVKPGENALGVILGNGRYWAPRTRVPIGTVGFDVPKLLLQLDLEYSDGHRESVVSDATWKVTAEGPVGVNNEYDGEEYDATREMPGWAQPGFDDAGWSPVEKLQPPEGELEAQMAEPLKVIETLKPIKLNQLRPGVYIYDMGQNMVGWVRLRVQGKKGDRVMLRFAETLRADGNLYLDNLRSARATDLYTLKGGALETWEPRFTYHGFRFVEITGYPGKPALASIEGRVVHDAMARTGEFESSDTMLNRIHHNIYWGIRGNYRSIPTDCPQRDERQGWLGDRSVVSRSESYLFDIAAFYTKWMNDLKDSQRASGSIPDVSPAYWVLYNDGIVWPSTFILAPDMIYQQYGDSRVIERNYPAMKRWVEYMRTFLKDGIMPKNTYADWCVPPEKPELIHSQDPTRVTAGALLSTAYYYHMLELMSRYAKLAGQTADIGEYQTLANTVKAAFLREYYKSGEAMFANGTQTSSILPLAFDMVPDGQQKAVFDHLVTKIEKESDNHVGVGLVGAQWLMRTLSDNGRPDLALTIATQKTYPGWGYMVEKGATTVWELWNGDTADPAMNSGNHVMQIGDLGVWMYEYLAGIRPDPAHPGFQHFSIQPFTGSGLNHVKASHMSPYGRILSSWTKQGSKVTMNVTVPPNSSATVYVPGTATGTGGLKPARTEGGRSVFEVKSGTYAFLGQ